MIVDTSAVLAVLLREEDRETFLRAILEAPEAGMSAVSKFEMSKISISRRGTAGVAELDAFIAGAGIRVVAFNDAQAIAALDAFARYGKGRHPAGLNFGDCCAYALAQVSGEPLLFKGEDFAATDVRPALPT